MKTMSTKLLSLLLALLLALGASAFAAEEEDPAVGEEPAMSPVITVGQFDDDGNMVMEIISDEYGDYETPVERYVYFEGKVHNDVLDGMTYDPETNVLTLNNVKEPNWELSLIALGKDFQICLVGENELTSIWSIAPGRASSILFTGSGSLTLNARKTMAVGLTMLAEGTGSVLDFGSETHLTIYGSELSVGICLPRRR